jgi:molybdate transport system ATP-binding protein
MAEEIIARFSKRFAGGPLIRIDEIRIPLGVPGVSVLFGPSGAGKTTLLRCIAGLERPDDGVIHAGREIWWDHAKGVCVSPQRRTIGYLAQDYALFPHLSVEKNIRYGLRNEPEAETAKRVADVLRLFDLQGLEKRRPRELSGGQQQRVALARAIVRRPRLLMLDEPLSALDLSTRRRLRDELRGLLIRAAIPTLLVTHDRAEALALGDEIIVMDSGQVVQRGRVEEVFSRPANLAVAESVAIETVQAGRIVEEREGLFTVQVGAVKLTALNRELPAEIAQVFVCIRAEDVILLKGDSPSSPRNHLAAAVVALSREGPMMRIDLDCGFPLCALLTRQACEELDVRPGNQVYALVKAPNVHLIPR